MDRDFKKKIIKDLDEIYEECKNDDWDFEDGKGITKESYNFILDFINNVMCQKDADFGFPNIVPFNSGDMGIEWNISNICIMTMIFQSDGDVIYSILTNNSKIYGAMNFQYKNLNSILDRIIVVLETGE